MKTLVVVDMQNDFITGPLGSPEAQALVEPMVDYIKKFDGSRVVYTYDTHREDYLTTNEGKHLPVEHCMFYSEGWKIPKELTKAAGIRLKLCYKNSFGDLDLIDICKGEDEDEIEICGVCTDICVVSNALLLKAAYPERKISVIENLCAGTSPEMHREAINVMKSCQIDIKTIS